jgi:hypothetical protein
VVTLTITVAVLSAAATTTSAQNNGKQQDGQGKYAELTADWWQWVFSLPVSQNPLFDETGAKAGNAQPEKKVFFLVGVINTSGTAQRTITVPAGQAMFFPVLNYEADNATIPPTNYTVPQLRNLAAQNEDAITELHVSLDGVSLLGSVSRIKSPVFSYTLPPTDNIYQFFGLDITGTIKPVVSDPVVSDGYWVYIPPLPSGTTHTLNFGGSSPGFSLEITYHITVQ